jgi:di/tricarboxylate transporter
MSLGLLFLGVFWGFFFFVLSMGRRKASREEVKKSLKWRLIISFGILFAILLFLFIAQPGM